MVSSIKLRVAYNLMYSLDYHRHIVLCVCPDSKLIRLCVSLMQCHRAITVLNGINVAEYSVSSPIIAKAVIHV